jgi:SAM-dependent methyltransferase
MVPERFRVTPWNIDAAWRYAAVVDLLRDVWRDDLEIVEIGSGSAGLTEWVEHPVTGVDVAFERTAASGGPLLRKVEGSATALPLPDASCDVVLCLEMLEHLEESQRVPALREMLRVLRPGGRLVATFPSGATARRLDAWLNERFRRRHGRDHPWAAEHIEHPLPDAAQLAATLEPLTADVRVGRHAWAPAWKLVHLLYTVEWGYPWTRMALVHTRPGAGLLFRLLRRLRGRDCYRAILVARR